VFFCSKIINFSRLKSAKVHIDNSVIYSNELVRPSFYCAKVCKLEEEASDYLFPKLLIYLQIHPNHEIGEIILTSIIHPTENSQPVFDSFKFTFLKNDDEEISEAVGRWGVVQIYNGEYGSSEYSVVRFVEQTGEYRRMVEELW